MTPASLSLRSALVTGAESGSHHAGCRGCPDAPSLLQRDSATWGLLTSCPEGADPEARHSLSAGVSGAASALQSCWKVPS